MSSALGRLGRESARRAGDSTSLAQAPDCIASSGLVCRGDEAHVDDRVGSRCPPAHHAAGITRNSFAWWTSASRSARQNSVPPLAVSSRPACRAPLGERALAVPNISDSSSASAGRRNSPRRATTGAPAVVVNELGEQLFPAPLSPVRNTDASVAATRRASAIALRTRRSPARRSCHRTGLLRALLFEQARFPRTAPRVRAVRPGSATGCGNGLGR